MFAFEVEEQADMGNGGAPLTSSSVYFEVRIEPLMDLIQLSPTMPVTLSIPMVAGFSVDDY